MSSFPHQSGEVLLDFSCGGAFARFARQQRLHQSGELVVDAFAGEAQRLEPPRGRPTQRLRNRSSLERQLAGQAFVEDDAQREDIGGRIRRLSLE